MIDDNKDPAAEITIFVAMEECTGCGDVVSVAMVVSSADTICKSCFDEVYEKAVEAQKRQIRCN